MGRQPESADLLQRHPFDVELCSLPSGKANFPYHLHSAQWEVYLVVSGTGQVRHREGISRIHPGNAFIFPPNEPHQLINDSTENLVYYVIADNPVGEYCYYPDSKKWGVKSPERRYIRSEGLKYEDGEE